MIKKKDYSFTYFLTTEEIYLAIRNLPWVETRSESRKLNRFGEEIFTKEGLKIRGKNFVVAYHCEDGDYVVREKFRFVCDGLLGMKLLMEAGGYTSDAPSDTYTPS